MSDGIDTSPAAIAAILEEVTRGPWRKDGVSVGRLPADESYVAVCVSSGTRSRLEAESNAAFIAAARDLVPALAAERDRLREALVQIAGKPDYADDPWSIARAAPERRQP